MERVLPVAVVVLLSAILLAINVQGMQFNGLRVLHGDFIGDELNTTQCFDINRAIDVESKCFCQTNHPVFHTNDNTTHGCYNYKDLCRECETFQEANFMKMDSEESLNTTVNGTLKEMLNECPLEDRIAALSILKFSEFVQVYVGQMEYDEDEAMISLKFQVNISLSPTLLEGKLAKMQVWCRNASSNQEIQKKSLFLKINGKFAYPDHDIYVVMTTTTTTPEPTVLPLKTDDERKGSKDMIFYVVVPIAAFLLLVAIVLLILNCREKKQKKNSYTQTIQREHRNSENKLEKLEDEEKNGEAGMFNPAYQTSTLAKGANTTPYNNNETIRKDSSQNPKGDIKIYTVVDLSQRPSNEVPLTRSTPERESPSFEKRNNQKNYFHLFDESLTSQEKINAQLDSSSESDKQLCSSEKDDISIKKFPDDDEDSDVEIPEDVSQRRNDSIRKDSVSSYGDDYDDADEVESLSYHSDNSMPMKHDIDDDIDVEIVKPPPITDEPKKDSESEDFVIVNEQLI